MTTLDELSVYTISGLYCQAPPSEDSEFTESTCASTGTYESAHASTCEQQSVLPGQQLVSEGEVIDDSCVSNLLRDERECGICDCRPMCLQRFASIKMFVLLCCALVTLQQTLSSGYLNSVITTIEKRFDINSSSAGAIASTYEIGNLITIIFVSYLGSRRHIPVWLGIGVLLMGIGSLLFVLPHFISPRYTLEEGIKNSSVEDTMCQPIDNGFLSLEASGSIHHRRDTCLEGNSSNGLTVFIFMIAQLLIGCGASPLFTLGTTYIDDHVKRESASLYIGCVYSMVAFGPVLGFLLGGYLLSFYVDSFLYDASELNISPSHPRWVGAWWVGFVVIGVLLLLVAVPFFAFPKSLRCAKKRKVYQEELGAAVTGVGIANCDESSTESGCLPHTRSLEKLQRNDEKSAKSSSSSSYGSTVKEIPRSIWNLITNPVYVITCLGSCMELMIVSGFVVFLPKYLETQFSISKTQANIFTGGIAIPGACVGVFMGGVILKKFKLTPKGAIQFVMLFNGTCLGLYVLVFFLGCDNVKMAGATMPYFNSTRPVESFQVNLTAMCNMGCECSSNDLYPICGSNGVTYFSPCHAGCTTQVPQSRFTHSYLNCACIVGNASTADNFHEVTVVPVATSGPCVHVCHAIIPFMVLLFIMSLAVSITQMPLLMIVLRSVSEEERSFALGMQFVIFRLFGYIPSPIMFGNMIDSSCLLWRANCSKGSGFCLMYDIEKFRYRYVGMCAAVKVVAAGLFFFDWFLIRKHRIWNAESSAVTVTDLTSAAVATSSMMSIDKLSALGTGAEEFEAQGEDEDAADPMVPLRSTNKMSN